MPIKVIKILLSREAMFLVVSYLLMFMWWLSIFARGVAETKENYLYGLCLGLVSMAGGELGLTHAYRWGLFRSRLGKALSFLSLGLITWGFGTIIIAYFNIFNNASYPYPSIADLFYIASWPFWFLGIINLFKVTGATMNIKNIAGKLFTVLVAVFGLFLSYYLLFIVARGGVFEIDTSNYLRLFLDFAYPFFDVIILISASLLYVLSAKYLGGLFKIPILIIIVGFLINYFADMVFTYTNTLGTFYVASWVDMLYTTALFFVAFGVNLINIPALEDADNLN